jgi:hypothetical protein
VRRGRWVALRSLVLHNARVVAKAQLFALGLVAACGAPPVELPATPVAVEASTPTAMRPQRDGACEALSAVVEDTERLLGRDDRAQRRAPAMLALADDLAERHVTRPPLMRWRGAFRAVLYQLALEGNVVHRVTNGGADEVATRIADEMERRKRELASRALGAWSRRLIGDARALGEALRSHCEGGTALEVAPGVDPAPPTTLILTETDEGYRLHHVARAWVTAYRSAGDVELLERMKGRIGGVHASQPEVAAARAALVGLVDELQRAHRNAEHEHAGQLLSLLELVVDELGSLWATRMPDFLFAAERERCDGGRDRSCIRVAIDLMTRGDLAEARTEAEKACGPAALHACALASQVAFRSGDDTLARRALAEHEALCDQGLAGACAVVAGQLEEGRLTAPDPARARALWLRLCGEVGGEASCAALTPEADEADEAAQAAWTRACENFGTSSACAALGRGLP